MLSVDVLLVPESEEHSVDEEADLRAMSVMMHAILGCRSSLQGGLPLQCNPYTSVQHSSSRMLKKCATRVCKVQLPQTQVGVHPHTVVSRALSDGQ